MDLITGTYDCKVDAKGRLMMPAALKKQLSSILPDGFCVCVVLCFKSVWSCIQWESGKILMQKMNKLNKFKKKNNDFIRRFTAGAKMVEVDVNGRLLIPKDLTVFC